MRDLDKPEAAPPALGSPIPRPTPAAAPIAPPSPVPGRPGYFRTADGSITTQSPTKDAP